jgi:hypothetical protein
MSQPLIDRSNLFARKFAEHEPDTPLVDRSQMIDYREGLLAESTLSSHEGRIKQSLPRSLCYRHHAHERKAWVADDFRISRSIGENVQAEVRGRSGRLYFPPQGLIFPISECFPLSQIVVAVPS